MTTDLDISRPFDWLERAEKRQFNLDFGKLGSRDGWEPRIRATGFYCAARHNLWEWFVGFDMADTPTQVGSLVQGDECAAKPQGHLSSIEDRGHYHIDMPGNCRACDAEKQFTIDFGSHPSRQHELSSAGSRSKRRSHVADD